MYASSGVSGGPPGVLYAVGDVSILSGSAGDIGLSRSGCSVPARAASCEASDPPAPRLPVGVVSGLDGLEIAGASVKPDSRKGLLSS